MTKRDYNIIAKVLKQSIIESKSNISDNDDVSIEELNDDIAIIETIAHNLGIAFMVDNPRFSIGKFMEGIRKK